MKDMIIFRSSNSSMISFFLYFRIERVCEVKTEEEEDVKFQGVN